MSKLRTDMIARLYRSMPGAPRIPVDPDSGFALWGEVEGNEHWEFCEQIVDLMAGMVKAVSK